MPVAPKFSKSIYIRQDELVDILPFRKLWDHVDAGTFLQPIQLTDKKLKAWYRAEVYAWLDDYASRDIYSRPGFMKGARHA